MSTLKSVLLCSVLIVSLPASMVLANDVAVTVSEPAPVLAAAKAAADVPPAPAPISAPEPVQNERVSVCGSVAGKLEASNEPMSYFYPAGVATKFVDGGVVALKAQGALSFDGKSYALDRVLLPKGLNHSTAEYPMDVRFDHVAQDGSRVVVVIPVKTGADNLSFEKILREDKDAVVDLNLLVPAGGERASAGNCMAGDIKIHRIVMTTPIEVSAVQLERFSKLF